MRRLIFYENKMKGSYKIFHLLLVYLSYITHKIVISEVFHGSFILNGYGFNHYDDFLKNKL
jgi:hypothetical protein